MSYPVRAEGLGKYDKYNDSGLKQKWKHEFINVELILRIFNNNNSKKFYGSAYGGRIIVVGNDMPAWVQILNELISISQRDNKINWEMYASNYFPSGYGYIAGQSVLS